MRISDKLREVTAVWVLFLLLASSGCEWRTTAPEEVQPGVRAVVSDALLAWQHTDWQKMYETLASADREIQTFQEFRQKRERLNKAQQLKSFRMGEIVPSGDGTFNVDVALEIEENYNSGYQADLKLRITETTAKWTVVGEGDSYKITFVDQELLKEN